MDLELKGKVAIVTGGSRGIGRAIVQSFASEQAVPVIVSRNLDVAQATAQAISAATGQLVHAYRADAGVPSDVSDVVRQIGSDLGRIDILVNCAAQPQGQGPVPKLADIEDANFFEELNVKVLGYLRFAREVVPYMRQQQMERIINIAGLAARQSGSIIGSVRNVGVAALTKNLADELGPDGINVTCVHPGLTRTEKTPGALQYHAAAQGVPPEVIEQRFVDATSIRHLVTAEEVAHIVAFLASPKSVAISGDAIAAGGGRAGSIYY